MNLQNLFEAGRDDYFDQDHERHKDPRGRWNTREERYQYMMDLMKKNQERRKESRERYAKHKAKMERREKEQEAELSRKRKEEEDLKRDNLEQYKRQRFERYYNEIIIPMIKLIFNARPHIRGVASEKDVRKLLFQLMRNHGYNNDSIYNDDHHTWAKKQEIVDRAIDIIDEELFDE